MKKVQDHYFHKAKKEGFAARSVYKLEEIDHKKGLLKPGLRVLDLGCAPGSWLQYIAVRVGGGGMVLGVDLEPVTVALPPQARAVQGDIHLLTPEELLGGGQGGALFDLVVSDMAPRTTGIPSADAARSAQLVQRTLDLAGEVLKPGGGLLAKIFQGSALADVRRAFGARFQTVSLEKPKATRSESVEVFLLGRGFKG